MKDSDIPIDELLKPYEIWVAEGNTYQHREELRSWGWHWDEDNKYWICDHITHEKDPCLIAIRELPGIIVRRLPHKRFVCDIL